jgi:hypothetical protein
MREKRDFLQNGPGPIGTSPALFGASDDRIAERLTTAARPNRNVAQPSAGSVVVPPRGELYQALKPMRRFACRFVGAGVRY